MVAAEGVVGTALGINRKERELELKARRLLRRYQRGGYAGLFLLIAGFFLQFVSNAMQRQWLGLPCW